MTEALSVISDKPDALGDGWRGLRVMQQQVSERALAISLERLADALSVAQTSVLPDASDRATAVAVMGWEILAGINDVVNAQADRERKWQTNPLIGHVKRHSD